MTLTTYRKPLSAFDALFNDRFDTFGPFFHAPPRQRRVETTEWFEDDSNYFVRMDLPGVSKEQLGIESEGDRPPFQ